MAEGDEINVKIGAQNQGLLSGLQQAENAISHSSGYIRASLSGLTDVVERIKLPFIELAAILAGGAAFRSFVEGTEQLGLELEKASAKTGIAVEDLSGLKFAAEQVDVSFNSLVMSAQRLSLAIQQQNKGAISPGAEALRALGISTKDASGNTKPLEEIIGEVADKFKGYKDGADKTALAMNLFGRAGAEMIPVLNQGREGMEAAKREATAMGAVMSGEAVDSAEKFHQAMGRVGLVGQSLKISLGTALMPVLTLMANAFADSAKEGGVLHEAILVLRDAIELVSVAVTGLVTGLRLLFDVGKFVINTVGNALVGLAEAFKDAEALDFAAVRDDLKATGKLISTDFNTMVDSMVEHAAAGGDAIRKTLGLGGPEGSTKPARKKNAPHVADPQELRKQWELEKAGFELELALADNNSIKIIEIKQRELARVRELFGEHSKEYLGMAAELARAENEEQKKGAEAYKKILHDQAEVEKKAFEERKRQWETLLSGISRSIETAVTGIIQGTTTMSAAIKNILKSLVAEYIAVGVKTLVAHKATELAKTGATVQGTAQRVALEQWAQVKSVALSAWGAITRIGQYAVEGAAAAFKAIAAIPIVGPFLAPAAAAAAGVAIMSFAGHVASAEGGYDIPRGLNPMTQLHSSEMVLPAELADRIRGLTGDGAAGGGDVHFHVSAIDAKGVKEFFREHGDKIVAAVKRGDRDFAFDAA